jgi:hypothetical protein
MALRAGWKNNPQFALSVGGFNPAYQAPPGFPTLARLAISLCSGDNPLLRLESYFAVTSNTIQCGARVDLHAASGGFSVDGFFLFDTLITLSPFGLEVAIGISAAVTYQGSVICSVSAALLIVGPGPWQVSGKASVSFLCISASVSFDATLGQGTPPPAPAAIDVAQLLAQAIGTNSNWSAQAPAGDAIIAVRSLPADGAVRAHPFATLTFRQQTAPLGITLECYGAAPISGADEFSLTAVQLGSLPSTTTAVTDQFAPAQFLNMSAAEKLSQPSFEPLQSGFTATFTTPVEDVNSEGDAEPLTYEVILVDSVSTTAPPSVTIAPATSVLLTMNGPSGTAPSSSAGARRFTGPSLGVKVLPRTFAVTNPMSVGGAPLFSATSWTEAAQALSTLQSTSTQPLQVVRT